LFECLAVIIQSIAGTDIDMKSLRPMIAPRSHSRDVLPRFHAKKPSPPPGRGQGGRNCVAVGGGRSTYPAHMGHASRLIDRWQAEGQNG